MSSCRSVVSRSNGFTLIELLVVLVVIGFLVSVAAGPLQNRSDQARADQTRTLLAEIEKAMLGQELPGEPCLRSDGYIPDMGGLPALIDGQPRGLWTPDLDGDGSDDLLRLIEYIDDGHEQNWGYAAESAAHTIWMGWRGPYIGVPKDGVLRDGWGNAVVFQMDTPQTGDLTILSPGANGMVADQDTGADADIAIVLRHEHFTAPVAGIIIPSGINAENTTADVALRLYYAAPVPDAAHANITDLAYMEPVDAAIGADGYFLFTEVPIGIDRLLEIRQSVPYLSGGKALTYLRFEVLPTLNWLGRLDIRNAYDTY